MGLIPDKFTVSLTDADRQRIDQILSLVTAIVTTKELVIRVSLDDKVKCDDIKKVENKSNTNIKTMAVTTSPCGMVY
jgi:hypothetical protein